MDSYSIQRHGQPLYLLPKNKQNWILWADLNEKSPVRIDLSQWFCHRAHTRLDPFDSKSIGTSAVIDQTITYRQEFYNACSKRFSHPSIISLLKKPTSYKSKLNLSTTLGGQWSIPLTPISIEKIALQQELPFSRLLPLSNNHLGNEPSNWSSLLWSDIFLNYSKVHINHTRRNFHIQSVGRNSKAKNSFDWSWGRYLIRQGGPMAQFSTSGWLSRLSLENKSSAWNMSWSLGNPGSLHLGGLCPIRNKLNRRREFLSVNLNPRKFPR